MAATAPKYSLAAVRGFYRRRPVAPVLLVGLAMTFSLAACSKPPADPRTLAPLVRVMTAAPGTAGAQEYTGVIAARVQSDLGFRVGGKIVERYVEAGQVVRRGQPLMRIDGSDLALAATAAEGSVAAARARAEQTAADVARLKGLVEAGAVSASTYDQARAAADAARAQLATASAQAGVARNQGRYSLLVADADGTVVETLAEPGQVIGAGQVVVRLARNGPREALVDLPENVRPDIGSVVQARTYGGVRATGTLRQLSDAADPLTRSYEARYTLGGPAANAPIGATVTVALPHAGGTGPRLAVPLGAVHDGGKGPGVWVVRKGKTARVAWHHVRIESVDEESAYLAGGIRPGDVIVAMGAHLLRQGQAVRVSRK
ncbi:efflux RND transporter periplasmic adaptor subunit [Sphingomonas sp. 35-24ZXX]|uniref:efflux RND transporter periplasmic adaptor subunit n=1 Tax=Sphingomonas sp. 35-24ZXX TaxID=1545915 RepID=UPI0009DF682F|nr:efflux RND transporter periplasmic adaptor subunit [Sphingomonas sp. 35-24ZXX]